MTNDGRGSKPASANHGLGVLVSGTAFSHFQLALVARNSAELIGKLFARKSGSNGIAQF